MYFTLVFLTKSITKKWCLKLKSVEAKSFFRLDLLFRSIVNKKLQSANHENENHENSTETINLHKSQRCNNTRLKKQCVNCEDQVERGGLSKVQFQAWKQIRGFLQWNFCQWFLAKLWHYWILLVSHNLTKVAQINAYFWYWLAEIISRQIADM